MKQIFDDMKFKADIERMCSFGTDYIDAITTWCEKNNLDIEVIANIIKKDPVIKSRIQADAESLNFLKGGGGAKLPF
jgi:HD-like signal output (HDOD) protein